MSTMFEGHKEGSKLGLLHQGQFQDCWALFLTDQKGHAQVPSELNFEVLL